MDKFQSPQKMPPENHRGRFRLLDSEIKKLNERPQELNEKMGGIDKANEKIKAENDRKIFKQTRNKFRAISDYAQGINTWQAKDFSYQLKNIETLRLNLASIDPNNLEEDGSQEYSNLFFDLKKLREEINTTFTKYRGNLHLVASLDKTTSDNTPGTSPKMQDARPNSISTNKKQSWFKRLTSFFGRKKDGKRGQDQKKDQEEEDQIDYDTAA